MEIGINDYVDADHYRSLNEDNFDVSRTCEDKRKPMNHMHLGVEVLFCEKGGATYFIEGKKYRMVPGSILIIGSRETHMRVMEELPFQRYGLTVKPSYLKTLNLDENLLEVFQTPGVDRYESHLQRADHVLFQNIVLLLAMLYGERKQQPEFSLISERMLISEIAILLFRAAGLEPKESLSLPIRKQMEKVREYIDQNFRGDLNLDQLSKHFFLHPVTISKEFKHCFGSNLSTYINRVRICESCYLLENTEYSILDIAHRCGYESINTFLRQFKAIMQNTPTQYRKDAKSWYFGQER